MLTDPIQIAIPSAAEVTAIRTGTASVVATHVGLAVTDVSPGGTKRVGVLGGDSITLSIVHSTTKENAPYVTTRSVIRLDHVRVDVNGKPVTLSAYVVIPVPQGTVFTTAEVLSHARAIGSFLLFGSVIENPIAYYGSGDSGVLQRVLNGEP